jgi:hypothetical protein
VSVTSKKKALEAVAALLGSADDTVAAQSIADGLFARERLGSTALGSGVAIPHTRSGAVDTATGAFLALAQHLKVLNDTVLTGKNCSRSEQWMLERPSLQPLPVQRYELRKIKMATVMKNGHIYLGEDQHYYSVPYELIGKKLSLQYSRSTVELYLNYELMACHKRVRSPHNYTTVAEHMPPQHRYLTEWSPEFFLRQGKAIDPIVEQYLKQVLDKKQHPEQAYKSCQGILMLEKRVGSRRMIKACRRAHDIGYYNYRIIQNILKKNLDAYDEDPSPQSMPSHENIRGADYYQ